MFDLSALKKIDLIVSDVDGTILNDRGEIGEKTIELIKQLKKSGVQFSFASGRLHSALMPIAQDLSIFTPIISLDGSVIKSINGDQYIYQSFLKKKHVDLAIRLSEDYLVNLALCHADAIYYTENNSVIPKLIDKYGAVYKEVPDYDLYTFDTLEMVFASDNRTTIEFLRDKFSFPYTFGCAISFFKSQTHEGIYYLEVRRAGSSKGKGFLRLLKHLNIKEKNAAVIGDWYNDLSLFETKALKIAMQNAIPELKRQADYVLKNTNNEEGITEFLEALLKAKRN